MFKLGRGYRQRGPLLPYLFLLCFEISAHKVKLCETIKGLNLEGVIIKLSQYAYDIHFILEGSQSKLETVMKNLILCCYSELKGTPWDETFSILPILKI